VSDRGEIVSCKIGLLGLGTVGTGVAKILLDPEGRHPVLREVEIKSVGVRSRASKRDVDLPASCYAENLESIVSDPDIEIVVEVIGGLEPARSLILQAIANGKHVVTANKAVLARYGAEIFTAAKASGVYVMLEASVGGGIPIIQALKQALGANRITAVTGIINGTTNYILSRMHNEGGAFEEILANAQALGYAEADPTADVDGYDAADKIAILASLAFGDRIKLEEIHREGIRTITSADIHWASELGFTIKLLGIAKRTFVEGESGLDIRVHPTLIPIDHPLASINGVTNAITVAGDPLGEVVFSGPGAGAGATASAVVADIINVVAALKAGSGKVNQLMGCSHQHYAKLHPIDSNETQFYVRLIARDRPGVIGELGTCFGKHLVNLESIVQKNSHDEFAEIVVVTKKVVERNFQTAIADIKNLASIQSIATVLRVL
jgi:homoserine dehydrogenase